MKILKLSLISQLFLLLSIFSSSVFARGHYDGYMDVIPDSSNECSFDQNVLFYGGDIQENGAVIKKIRVYCDGTDNDPILRIGKRDYIISNSNDSVFNISDDSLSAASSFSIKGKGLYDKKDEKLCAYVGCDVFLDFEFLAPTSLKISGPDKVAVGNEIVVSGDADNATIYEWIHISGDACESNYTDDDTKIAPLTIKGLKAGECIFSLEWCNEDDSKCDYKNKKITVEVK